MKPNEGDDERREGDDRPFHRPEGVKLTFTPTHDEPFRWRARQGDPTCIAEWAVQSVVQRAPLITLVIVAISLFLQVLLIWGLL